MAIRCKSATVFDCFSALVLSYLIYQIAIAIVKVIPVTPLSTPLKALVSWNKDDDLRVLVNNPNIRAFLDTIAYAEGTSNKNGYRTMFTGKTFNSFARHPNISICDFLYTGQKICSTAAGRYQFLSSTWYATAKALSLKDFSPHSQDIGAVLLIKNRQALTNILNGEFNTAIHKLAPEWASLPTKRGTSYYKGQRARPLSKLQEIYKQAGGKISK